jgi:hypothetical protein
MDVIRDYLSPFPDAPNVEWIQGSPFKCLNMGLLSWKQPRKGAEMCKLITWPDMSACIVVVPLDVSSTVCSVGVNFMDLNEVGCELGRPLL